MNHLASKEWPDKRVTTGNSRSIDSMNQPLKRQFVATSTNKESRSKRSGCSNLRLKAHVRPKSELPGSIRREPHVGKFGHSTAKFEIGTLVNRRKRETETKYPLFSSFFLLTFLSYCLSFTFASPSSTINVASHNLHSFKQSVAYHKQCIQTHGGIWMAQEHWLSEQQLSSLQQLGTQFVARSGMEEAVSKGVLSGRPFGGVSISWSADLNHLINPLSNFRHKRIVAIELKTTDLDFVFICVYMPYFNAARRAECMADTVDAISMIESIIEQHPTHAIIIGGDINSEMKGESPFDSHWDDLMARFNLTSCDPFFPSSSKTYRHQSLDHTKWNDHFIVSASLCADSTLSNFHILDEGENVSDHLPIVMTLSSKFSQGAEYHTSSDYTPKLKWSKLNDGHKSGYTSYLHQLVQSRPSQFSPCQQKCRCDSVDCHFALQNEYDVIIQCLQEADSILPRFKPGVEKDWWTKELSCLKKKSIVDQPGSSWSRTHSRGADSRSCNL